MIVIEREKRDQNPVLLFLQELKNFRVGVTKRNWNKAFNPFHPIGPYLASIGPLPIKMSTFLRLFDDHISFIQPMNKNMVSKFS